MRALFLLRCHNNTTSQHFFSPLGCLVLSHSTRPLSREVVFVLRAAADAAVSMKRPESFWPELPNSCCFFLFVISTKSVFYAHWWYFWKVPSIAIVAVVHLQLFLWHLAKCPLFIYVSRKPEEQAEFDSCWWFAAQQSGGRYACCLDIELCCVFWKENTLLPQLNVSVKSKHLLNLLYRSWVQPLLVYSRN